MDGPQHLTAYVSQDDDAPQSCKCQNLVDEDDNHYSWAEGNVYSSVDGGFSKLESEIRKHYPDAEIDIISM